MRMVLPIAAAMSELEAKARLDAVHDGMKHAAKLAGRKGDEVTLIAISKTHDADAIRPLIAAGQRVFGENRVQEAEDKWPALIAETPGLELHLVGQLQSNKAASVARYADLVHSVDRESLITALERGAAKADRELPCLIEVDLTEGADGRGGARPPDVARLAGLIVSADHLTLRGVMGVAPLAGAGEDQREVSARAFERLAAVSEGLRREHPDATFISAGMSEDLEEAVHAGATHLRVGSAVLGTRPPLG